MKTFRYWIPLLILGISGLFTFTLLSGTQRLDSPTPQTDEVKELIGDTYSPFSWLQY